jgi:hypothetical protein
MESPSRFLLSSQGSLLPWCVQTHACHFSKYLRRDR